MIEDRIQMNKTVGFILGFIGIIIAASTLPWLLQYLWLIKDDRKFDELDKRAQKVIQEQIDQGYLPKNPDQIPVAKVTYTNVPDTVREKQIDCSNPSIVPPKLRNASFFCENIYRVNPNTLEAAASASGATRLLLYGQYSSFDCPIQAAGINDPVTGCYNAAKFMDNWQLPMVAKVLGAPLDLRQIHYHFTPTVEETTALCGRQDASACADRLGTIYMPVGNNFNHEFTTAGLFTRGAMYAGPQKEVYYEFAYTVPRQCYMTDLHETLHEMHSRTYGIAPEWFEEGMVRLELYPFNRVLCEPGVAYDHAFKKVNGVKTEIGAFNPDDLLVAEPLQAGLETYARGNQCRKGIFMQIGRSIKSQGLGYLPKLYAALKGNGMSPSISESAIAQAVYQSTGNDKSAKDFLVQQTCSL